MENSNQILTVVVPARNAIELRCPHCQAIPERIGAQFCSTCGKPLVWDNISVEKPTQPVNNPADKPIPNN